jgi:hypothetical protein
MRGMLSRSSAGLAAVMGNVACGGSTRGGCLSSASGAGRAVFGGIVALDENKGERSRFPRSSTTIGCRVVVSCSLVVSTSADSFLPGRGTSGAWARASEATSSNDSVSTARVSGMAHLACEQRPQVASILSLTAGRPHQRCNRPARASPLPKLFPRHVVRKRQALERDTVTFAPRHVRVGPASGFRLQRPGLQARDLTWQRCNRPWLAARRGEEAQG